MSPWRSASGVLATSSATSTAPAAVWMRARGPVGLRQPPTATASAATARVARSCNVGTRSLSESSMVTALVFSLCVAVAMGVFFRQLWLRFNLLRAAQPAPLFDRFGERVRAVFVYFFGQQKFVRPSVTTVGELGAGLMHFFI